MVGVNTGLGKVLGNESLVNAIENNTVRALMFLTRPLSKEIGMLGTANITDDLFHTLFEPDKTESPNGDILAMVWGGTVLKVTFDVLTYTSITLRLKLTRGHVPHQEVRTKDIVITESPITFSVYPNLVFDGLEPAIEEADDMTLSGQLHASEIMLEAQLYNLTPVEGYPVSLAWASVGYQSSYAFFGLEMGGE